MFGEKWGMPTDVMISLVHWIKPARLHLPKLQETFTWIGSGNWNDAGQRHVKDYYDEGAHHNLIQLGDKFASVFPLSQSPRKLQSNWFVIDTISKLQGVVARLPDHNQMQNQTSVHLASIRACSPRQWAKIDLKDSVPVSHSVSPSTLVESAHEEPT